MQLFYANFLHERSQEIFLYSLIKHYQLFLFCETVTWTETFLFWHVCHSSDISWRYHQNIEFVHFWSSNCCSTLSAASYFSFAKADRVWKCNELCKGNEYASNKHPRSFFSIAGALTTHLLFVAFEKSFSSVKVLWVEITSRKVQNYTARVQLVFARYVSFIWSALQKLIKWI